jgi:hypothetical protein
VLHLQYVMGLMVMVSINGSVLVSFVRVRSPEERWINSHEHTPRIKKEVQTTPHELTA